MYPNLSSFKKVVWAINAFEPFRKIDRAVVDYIRAFQERTGTEIQPVFVLSGMRRFSSQDGQGLEGRERSNAGEALRRKLETVKIKRMLKAEIILDSSSPGKSAADLVIDYSLKVGADMMFLHTHGRTGLKRFIFGSFTESLLFHAPVPTVITGPGLTKYHSLNTLLFATDFGKDAKVAFRKAVSIAKNLKSKLIIFHSVPNPVEPIFQSGVYLLGGYWIPIHSYFSNEVDRQTRRVLAWAKWAQKQNVIAEAVVCTQTKAIFENIVSAAQQKKAGMILMDSHAGPVSSTVLGSITRQVIRNAHCPVWVFERQRPAQSKNPPAEKNLSKAA